MARARIKRAADLEPRKRKLYSATLSRSRFRIITFSSWLPPSLIITSLKVPLQPFVRYVMYMNRGLIYPKAICAPRPRAKMSMRFKAAYQKVIAHVNREAAVLQPLPPTSEHPNPSHTSYKAVITTIQAIEFILSHSVANLSSL